MTEIEHLEKAILDQHGCASKHIASIPVREQSQDGSVWEGNVELFLLLDHEQAKEAYAWIDEKAPKAARYVVMLVLPPVSSASDAVMVYMSMQ